MIFNNTFLKYDQYGFQQILFVGVCLSLTSDPWANSYSRIFSTNVHHLSHWQHAANLNPRRLHWLLSWFTCHQKINCGTFQLHDQRLIVGRSGWHLDWLPYLTQDHWELVHDRIRKKHSFISRLTLAVLESTGWYPTVNYSMTESTTWGRNKGCSIFDIDDCNSAEFCQGSNFGC